MKPEMKLTDILVEWLPSRDGWPEGAECCHLTQYDRHCLTIGFYHSNASAENNAIISKTDMVFSGIGCLGDTLHDCTVTAEQYEAALAAKNDGWIDWGGGKCPVSASEMVDVIFGRGGRRSTNIADCWRWNHNGTDSDIIAYRLHQPTKSEQVRADAWNAYAGITEPDAESDLNECIGQAPATEWNGEGLPPVGCECEYSLNGGVTWWKCKIDYIVGTQGVVMLCDTFEGVQYVQFSSYGSSLKFRPARSEAERKRDAATNALMGILGGCGGPHSELKSGEIYDAIAAGEIPGVKLED